MDANGTRFHLLLGMDDWGACSVEDQSLTLRELWDGLPTGALLTRQGWDAARSELTLPAEVFELPVAQRNVEPLQEQRRGTAADAYGNWFWIDDAETSILVKSSGSGAVSTFWSVDSVVGPTARAPSTSPGDFGPCPADRLPPGVLRGLAVNRDHYLIAGVAEPPGLLIFDLHAGGLPRCLAWPAGFHPLDISSAGGCTWILDRDRAQSGGRLWLLDEHLNPVPLQAHVQSSPPPAAFQAVDGTSPLAGAVCRSIPSLSSDLAFELPAACLPVAVEALADGSALILDNMPLDFSQVWRFTPSAGLREPYSLRDIANLIPADRRLSFNLFGHDVALLVDRRAMSEGIEGTLLVVSQTGDQVFAFAISLHGGGPLQLDALPEYWPMRLYAGRGLLTDGETILYDSRGTWVPLVQQPRLRYQHERTVLSPVEPDPSRTHRRHAFDAGDPDCVWHRLLLDGCVPPETAVHIWSRAANTEADLLNAEWRPEPDPYRRGDGSELPFARDTGSAERGTWELLFQRARGRFLQLRISLVGNTRSSPRLGALRVYYPRFSYLEHYLPAAFSGDPESASFLDRFLANLEGLYTTLEDRLTTVQALFDPRAAPAEDLAWLATWLGVVLDGNWEPARQRLLIQMAPELFRLRGTRQGVIRAIRLATDACPSASIFDNDQDDEGPPRPGQLPSSIRVVEQFRTRLAPGVVFGDPSQVTGPGVSAPSSVWSPAQGPAPLHARFRVFLQQVYPSLEALRAAWGEDLNDISDVELPATRPADTTMAADWMHFLLDGLGFTYAAVDNSDAAAYRGFLNRRYATPDALNQAYGLGGATAITSFNEIVMPRHLPTQSDQLRDWIQFVSILVPTLRNAHRFTVLLPTLTGDEDAERGLLFDRVKRVVELEKPAHTAFDVKEYWALFRVGEARVGLDTLVDRGSRLVPVVLDATYLAQGYLTPPHPDNLVDRLVLGRDRLDDRRPL